MTEQLEISSPNDSENNRKRKRLIVFVLLISLGSLCVVLSLMLILTFVLCLHCPDCDSDYKQGTSVSEEKFTTQQSLVHFIHLTDVNLDLKYNSSIPKRDMCRAANGSIKTAEFKAPLGRIGCDTPLLLLESSLEAIKNATEDTKLNFILISGDFSAHEVDVDEQHILEAMIRTANKTHAVFPDIPVFPVIGLHDYLVPLTLPNTSDWYNSVLSPWEPLMIYDGSAGDASKSTFSNTLRETFLEGGYYNASIADGRMILIVLNTIYWHYKSNQDNLQVRKTALSQLSWLESQLESAEGQGKRVLIASHIPPGVDVDDHEPFWLPSFTKRYMDLVGGRYHKVIAGQLFGHVHKDDFRLQTLESNSDSVSNDARKSFALIAPSLSPDYRSNPAFRVMILDEQSMSLYDYNQYYIDLDSTKVSSTPVWRLDYTFSKKYPLFANKSIDADGIYKLTEALINNENDMFWKAYAFSRQVNYWPDYYPRAVLYCSMRYVFKNDYEKCLLRMHF